MAYPRSPARRRALGAMGAVLFAPCLAAQPRPQRIGFLSGGMQPDESIQRHIIQPFREGLRALRRYAEPLGLQTQAALATTPEQFAEAFEAIKRGRAEAVMVLADPMLFMHKGRIAELCTQHRLPSVWGGRDYLHGGGLASYQSDFIEVFSRGAVLADQILKGAKPAEMPFERANKLVLVINLKAARALGISVPRALLLSADEVLE